MSITLGTVPENLTVVLTKDADFFTTLENADGNWPSGATIQLIFEDGTIWDSVISGENATFSIDATEVNLIIDLKPRTVKLFYKEGTTEICWALGGVQASV